MLQRLGLQCSTGMEAGGNFVGLDAGISLTLFSEKTPHSLKPDVTRRPGSLMPIASARALRFAGMARSPHTLNAHFPG
jgi:hypothetical protein